MPCLQHLHIDIFSERDEIDLRECLRGLRASSIDEEATWDEDDEGCRVSFTSMAASAQLHSLSVHSHSRTPYTFVAKEVIEFLRKHRNSMRRMSFQNVVFYDTGGDPDDDDYDPKYFAAPGMRDILKYIAEDMELESIVMRVPKLGCVEPCPTQDIDAIAEEHDEYCGAYFGGFSEMETLQTFEALAKELNIELEDGGWDFAKHLRLQ